MEFIPNTVLAVFSLEVHLIAFWTVLYFFKLVDWFDSCGSQPRVSYIIIEWVLCHYGLTKLPRLSLDSLCSPCMPRSVVFLCPSPKYLETTYLASRTWDSIYSIIKAPFFKLQNTLNSNKLPTNKTLNEPKRLILKGLHSTHLILGFTEHYFRCH